jgi:hypothetical protein
MTSLVSTTDLGVVSVIAVVTSEWPALTGRGGRAAKSLWRGCV